MGKFHSGLDSSFNFVVSGISAVMPISLCLPLPKKIELGRRSPVEFILALRTNAKGELLISLDHVISQRLLLEINIRGQENSTLSNTGSDDSQNNSAMSPSDNNRLLNGGHKNRTRLDPHVVHMLLANKTGVIRKVTDKPAFDNDASVHMSGRHNSFRLDSSRTSALPTAVDSHRY